MLNKRVTSIPERGRVREKVNFLIDLLKEHGGINIPTEQIQQRYYEKYWPQQNYGTYYYTKRRRQDLVRTLQKAAECDLIDGDWVGNGYRWSLKPRDRNLVRM